MTLSGSVDIAGMLRISSAILARFCKCLTFYFSAKYDMTSSASSIPNS
jgi:hypothetical protein